VVRGTEEKMEYARVHFSLGGARARAVMLVIIEGMIFSQPNTARAQWELVFTDCTHWIGDKVSAVGI